MPDITPFLWFDTEADEAARFYVSVFPNSKINKVMRTNDAVPVQAGDVLTVDFELDGRAFTALNGGPAFKFTEAVSFVVHCKDQAEIDRYWKALCSGGGVESQCGWLKDKYGLSWQIVPDRLLALMAGPHAKAVTDAMLTMKKLDLATLERAAMG